MVRNLNIALKLIVCAALLSACSACLRRDVSNNTFVFDESLEKHTYTAQQISEGKADSPFEWGFPARSVKSFEEIGLDARMLNSDYYVKAWGEPDSKTGDEIHSSMVYYPGAKPASEDPLEYSKYPSILVSADKGIVSRITAHSNRGEIDAKRFLVGKLMLMNNTRKDFEKVLGKPTSVIEVPDASLASDKWHFLIGQAPKRIALTINATFISGKCSLTWLQLAPETQSGAQMSLALPGRSKSAKPKQAVTYFYQGTGGGYETEQVEKGLASPSFGGGKPPRKVKSLADIGLDPEYLKSGALIKLWGKPSRDFSGLGTAPEARNDEMFVYYMGQVPASNKMEDWLTETNITVWGESGLIYSISAMSMETVPKPDWHLFGKLKLIGGTLAYYKDCLGETAPGSDEASGALHWYFLCGESPKRTAVSIQALFTGGISSMVTIDLAYETQKESSEPKENSK